MSERIGPALSGDQEALKSDYGSMVAPKDALARARAMFESNPPRRLAGLPLGIPVGAAAALVLAVALWSGSVGREDDHGLPLSPPARQFAIPALSNLGATPRSGINFALPTRPALSTSRVTPASPGANASSKSIDEV